MADKERAGRRRMDFAAMFGCDVFRIYEGGGRKFLILGWTRNTAKIRDKGQWYKNGVPINFDYLEEKVVASGRNDDELLVSAKEYKRIGGLTMQEFLQECAQ